MTDLEYALGVMGFSSIREGQQEIIDNVLEGNDTLAVMPTGRGKSATFILPTLANRWRCLVFSPLIALQQDQVAKLKEKGIAAEYVNSSNSDRVNKTHENAWMNGHLQFLYAAPERLNASRFAQMIATYAPDLIVVDEVHVAGTAGEDFRPSYQKIANAVREARHSKEATVLCLTATLTPDNEKNVRRILDIGKARRLTYWESRDNLTMVTAPNRFGMSDVLKEVNNSRGSVIVYSATVAEIENDVYPALEGKVDGGVVKYHGQMTTQDRNFSMKVFMSGKAKCVVATNAFGMGVDKSNIRTIIHTGLPGSIEDYVQESGRAGRDGKPSKCLLAPSPRSINVRRAFIENRNPDRKLIEQVWRWLRGESRNGKVVVKATVAQVACGLRIPKKEAKISTVFSILKAAGLIVRNEADYRDSITVVSSDLEGQPTWVKDAIRKLQSVPGGSVQKPPKEVSKMLGYRQVRDCAKKLQYLHNAGLINYKPASRAKTTTVKADKDLDSAVDWDRLAKKRNEEERVFKEMLYFLDKVPDENKHEVISQYFRTGSVYEED